MDDMGKRVETFRMAEARRKATQKAVSWMIATVGAMLAMAFTALGFMAYVIL